VFSKFFELNTSEGRGANYYFLSVLNCLNCLILVETFIVWLTFWSC